jgi:hypothetical protein
MAELIYEHRAIVTDSGGRSYAVKVFARFNSDRWESWLEFHPQNRPGLVLRTDCERTDPTRTALESWAQDLHESFLQHALARAFDDTASRCSEPERRNIDQGPSM